MFKRLGMGDHRAVINAVVGKILNVLRFRAHEPELVHRAVRLLMELATGPVGFFFQCVYAV